MKTIPENSAPRRRRRAGTANTKLILAALRVWEIKRRALAKSPAR